MVNVKVTRILLAILLGSLLSPGLAAREAPRLAPELVEQTVILEFTDRTLGKICEALGESSGIRFVFDDKTDLNRPLDVSLGSMPLAKALDLLMLQSKNFYKPLDDRTVLVAPDTRQKRQEYEDQAIQTFYLDNADSKEIVTLLRSLLQARQISESRAHNSVTIKDTVGKVEIAGRLIEAADRDTGEVVVELELLEVPRGSERHARDVAAGSIRNVPGAVSLARPQLRIINGREGSIYIGDSVALPATASSSAEEQPAEPSGAPSYEDIGIEIGVVARVGVDRQVTVELEIGISSVSPDGSPPARTGQEPVISRRRLETTMRLADGETHLVSSLPAFGRPSPTGDSADTELILLVTPRVTREPHIASEDRSPLWVGTEENMKM